MSEALYHGFIPCLRFGTLAVSYSAGTDRTYVNNRVEDDDGYRFEFYIEGDQTASLSESDFVFA